MKQSLSFLIILAITSISFGQSQLKTSFYFPLFFKDYSDVLLKNKFDGAQQSKISQITIAAPYSTVLSNTTMNFDYKAQVLPIAQSFGSFNYNIDIQKSSFAIDKVVTNSVIEKNVGGAIVRIYLNGECQGISVSSNSLLKIAGNFHINTSNGRLATQMDDFSLSTTGDWTIQTQSCKGPAGYQQALETEIRDLLKDPATLKGLLAQHLQDKFSSMTEALNKSLFSAKTVQISEKLKVHINPEQLSFDSSNGKIVLQGQLITESSSGQNKIIDIPASLDPEEFKKFSSSGLLVSHEYTQALNKFIFDEKLMKKSMWGQDISGFMTLLSNRFYQFFLWPDLMNYSTSSPFQFIFSAIEQPNFRHLGYSQGALWYAAEGSLQAKMLAPQGDSLVPYINFTSPISMNIWLQVSHGQLVIGGQDTQMNIQPAWFSSYLRNHNPSTSMGVDTIQSHIISAIPGIQLSYDLPKINVDQKNLLIPKKFFSTKKWVQLIYGAP